MFLGISIDIGQLGRLQEDGGTVTMAIADSSIVPMPRQLLSITKDVASSSLEQIRSLRVVDIVSVQVRNSTGDKLTDVALNYTLNLDDAHPQETHEGDYSSLLFCLNILSVSTVKTFLRPCVGSVPLCWGQYVKKKIWQLVIMYSSIFLIFKADNSILKKNNLGCFGTI